MYFAPIVAALVACAQVASVLAGNTLQISPRDPLYALARRQGTCPAGTYDCTGDIGCCPDGSACTGDGHCDVSCTPADIPCVDGCCPAGFNTVCRDGQCFVDDGGMGDTTTTASAPPPLVTTVPPPASAPSTTTTPVGPAFTTAAAAGAAATTAGSGATTNAGASALGLAVPVLAAAYALL